MVIGEGFADRYLTDDEVCLVVQKSLGSLKVDGKRVLMIIPDGTRTMPAPLMFSLFERQLAPRVAALDYLVALGTHPLMSDEQLSRLVGRPVEKGRAGASRIFNHHWEDPATFVSVGVIPASEIAEMTGGLMEQEIPVRINKLIFDYDQVIICGPVFPHEIVGFSGGTKYFFPGIGGGEIIDQTHWAGALITNTKIIGTGYTPIRAMIDRAVRLIDRPSACFALVVTHEGVAGLYFGSPEEAWKSASALSAKKHIIYVKKPFRRVLSIMPKLYDDFWTGGKGVYKLEPAVADGGEIVIYAPHINEVSYTHGKVLDEIGYHCRDYFVAQWDKFKRYPGGVLAHSTYAKGAGKYDAAAGKETPRIQVTLATGIPPERCRRINLDYLDPASVHPEEWKGREDEGILLVPRAGEMLYRVQ
ncbi:MAG TPA: lactate racemase domain-containing protein [Terriglobia bacterium]|nr:lactate racemase domain-containing protein [Terriglobia bacterium]